MASMAGIDVGEGISKSVLDELNQKLGALKVRAEMEIKTSEQLTESGSVKLDLESYIRSVEHTFEPELAPAEEKVRRLKIAMSSMLGPAKQWLVGLVNRQREYTSEEKRKAKAEEDRINEKARQEARKTHTATPPPVTVKPNVTHVPGVRNQTYYYADVPEPEELLRAYDHAKGERKAFLRRFITVSATEVGKFARETKDSNKVNELLPGVKAYDRG